MEPIPTLDRKRPCSTVRRMSTTVDRLRAQDWGKLQAQLTAFAYKRIKRRSWETARELAADAIANAWERGAKGWDPQKEPIQRYLAREVIGLALNEWRRHRNRFELLVTTEDGFDYLADVKAGPGAAPDEQLDERRVLAEFKRRLAKAVEGNRVAEIVLTLMDEEIDEPRDQAAASGIDIKEIRNARRVLDYHRDIIGKELAREMEVEEEVAREQA